jgi:hypothetical protein
VGLLGFPELPDLAPTVSARPEQFKGACICTRMIDQGRRGLVEHNNPSYRTEAKTPNYEA